jgi:hypothetical protein
MPLLGTRLTAEVDSHLQTSPMLLAGALRMLRDPDNPDYEHDEDEE